MAVAKTTKPRTKKAETVPMTTRKKKHSDIQDDWALTDFSEEPTKGNIHSIEVGDFVELTRSAMMLNGNCLWMRGIEFRVKKLTTLDSGFVVAETIRQDGTEVQFYACWLKPVLIKEPLAVQQEESDLEPMLD